MAERVRKNWKSIWIMASCAILFVLTAVIVNGLRDDKDSKYGEENWPAEDDVHVEETGEQRDGVVEVKAFIRNQLAGGCLYTVTMRASKKSGEEVGTGTIETVSVGARSEEYIFVSVPLSGSTGVEGPFVAEPVRVERAC
ncbi:hypothetical protein [Streptomyces zagrosensis]|uniref:Uncharacterized protein n=1 Tax=Streptomyces zagrosensis TaxID=1042984 RepID=A0A7W9QGD9_9ACTN|nr:hypothetical protein [Streptomyces zagrosensis]MBB5939238.1 hypothetical protein [Streptomyces zagrosensis]